MTGVQREPLGQSGSTQIGLDQQDVVADLGERTGQVDRDRDGIRVLPGGDDQQAAPPGEPLVVHQPEGDRAVGLRTVAAAAPADLQQFRTVLPARQNAQHRCPQVVLHIRHRPDPRFQHRADPGRQNAQDETDHGPGEQQHDETGAGREGRGIALADDVARCGVEGLEAGYPALEIRYLRHQIAALGLVGGPPRPAARARDPPVQHLALFLKGLQFRAELADGLVDPLGRGVLPVVEVCMHKGVDERGRPVRGVRAVLEHQGLGLGWIAHPQIALEPGRIGADPQGFRRGGRDRGALRDLPLGAHADLLVRRDTAGLEGRRTDRMHHHLTGRRVRRAAQHGHGGAAEHAQHQPEHQQSAIAEELAQLVADLVRLLRGLVEDAHVRAPPVGRDKASRCARGAGAVAGCAADDGRARRPALRVISSGMHTSSASGPTMAMRLPRSNTSW